MERTIRAVRRLNLPSEPIPGLDESINRFIAIRKGQGSAKRTLEDYNRYLKKFLSLSGNDMDIQHLEKSSLHFFSQYDDKAITSFNLSFKVLSRFFNWCDEVDYLPYNPLKNLGLKQKKQDYSKIKHHEMDTIQSLLKVIDLKTYSGLRDYSLILLTLDTGIRPSEAFGLRISDIDLAYNKIVVKSGIAKSRVSRILFISTIVTETLAKLISYRFEQFENFLFISCDGRPLNRNSWGIRLRKYCQKAGCPKVAPYDLRHTFAVQFLKNQGNVFALQEIMGHADISTTKHYIRFAENDIKEQHIKASPINNLIKRASRIKRNLK